MPTVSVNAQNQFTVKLSKEEVDSFLPAAEEKSKKYTEISPDKTSPYGFNHVHSHHVGMQAEFAAHEFLKWVSESTGIHLDIEAIYANPRRDGEADLNLNGTRIDVKCLSERSWKQYGPCISTRQFPRLCIKAEVVLWIVYNTRRRTFTLKGYNYMKDVRDQKTVMNLNQETGQSIENYPVIDILYDTEKLTSQEHIQKMKSLEPQKSTRKQASFYAGFKSTPTNRVH